MDKAAVLDFLEGSLTILAAGGAVGMGLTGSTFPGWWPLTCAAVPLLVAAVTAGVRKVQAGRRPV